MWHLPGLHAWECQSSQLLTKPSSVTGLGLQTIASVGDTPNTVSTAYNSGIFLQSCQWGLQLQELWERFGVQGAVLPRTSRMEAVTV